MSIFKRKQKSNQSYGSPGGEPNAATRNAYGRDLLQGYTPGHFPAWNGGGRCDVCLKSLAGTRAFAVPNSIFWNSPKYIAWNKERGVDEAFLRMQAANDPSPGSAICEDCIHMFK